MYKCVSEYYYTFILSTGKANHKHQGNQIISFVLICFGFMLIMVPSLFANYSKLSIIAIWFTILIGFIIYIFGFIRNKWIVKKYWEKNENIIAEMDNVSDRADLLVTYLRRVDVNLYHRDTLQYLIEECNEEKNESNSFLAVFAGTGVTAYVAGLISSASQAILTDVIDKNAKAMGIPIYIFLILMIAEVIMFILAAGNAARDYEEKKRIKIKKLQGDLKFILATFDNR